MEFPADFLSLGRRSVNLVLEPEYTITYSLRRSDTCQVGIRAVLGQSSPVFLHVFHSISYKIIFIMIFLLQPILFC